MPIFRLQSSKSEVQNFRKSQSLVIIPRGFTLIELLVVLAIIGILSVSVLANYSNFGAKQEVKNAAAELKTNLRKYQTYAFSGQKNPDPANPACLNREMNFFAVILDDDDTYHAVLDCGPSTDHKTVNLPAVDLPKGLTISASCPPGSPALVEFYPLNREARPCGTAGGSVDISISNGTTTYIVTVNSSGEIYEHQ